MAILHDILKRDEKESNCVQRFQLYSLTCLEILNDCDACDSCDDLLKKNISFSLFPLTGLHCTFWWSWDYID